MMNAISRTCGSSVVAVGFAVLAMARPVAAQPSSDGSFELSLTYGTNRNLFSLAEPAAAGLRLAGFRDVRIDGQSTNQHNIGLNAAASVSQYLLVFTEFLYNDLGESRISGRAGFLPRANFSFKTRLFEWTSGVRVQFPAGTWRVRPYVGGGAGTAWVKLEGVGAGGGATVSASETARDFRYHFDAGVRVFLTSVFGIAPEFRVVNIPDDRFYRVLVSAVFRVG